MDMCVAQPLARLASRGCAAIFMVHALYEVRRSSRQICGPIEGISDLEDQGEHRSMESSVFLERTTVKGSRVSPFMVWPHPA